MCQLFLSTSSGKSSKIKVAELTFITETKIIVIACVSDHLSHLSDDVHVEERLERVRKTLLQNVLRNV